MNFLRVVDVMRVEHPRRFSETQLPVDARSGRGELKLVRKTFGIVLSTVSLALFAIGFTSCGGTDRRNSVNPAATTAARFVELRSDTSAGTIHFPRGLYSLDTEDGNGYYYRAPGKVYQRSFSGRYPFDGGIFVSKRNQRKLRGYVIMPGGLTHVGNLSGSDYQFRY
jgi:hypothetical protein